MNDPAAPELSVMTTAEKLETMESAIVRFRELIEQGGPSTSADDEDLHRIFRIVARKESESGTGVDHFWAQLPPSFINESLMGHIYRKPYGYAGDFAIIDAIHRDHRSPDPRWTNWDAFLQRQGCAEAVRNRAALLPEWIDEVAARKPGKTMRILSLGSGPGRDIADALAARPESDLHFDGVDWEPAAIRHATGVCSDFSDRVRFIKADALRFRPEGEYDLVYSAGLFDYFSDRAFRKCLAHFWKTVAPGGMLVVGNFRRNRRVEVCMGFAKWQLLCRDAGELENLAGAASKSPDDVEIRSEPSGNNLFLMIQKRR